MRRWIQARAGQFVAGLGLLVIGTMIGCTNAPLLPNFGNKSPNNSNTNTNIPRTNVNNGTPTGNGMQPNAMNNGNAGGVNSANSMNRMSGPPAGANNQAGMYNQGTMNNQGGMPNNQVGMNMGAMAAPGNPAGNAGSPPYLGGPLGPPPATAGVQPIATSNPGPARTVQPTNYNAPAGAPTYATPNNMNAGPQLDLDPTPGAQNMARPRDLPPVQPISAADLDRPTIPSRNWQKPKAPQMADLDLPTLEPKGPPMPNPRGADALGTLGPPPGGPLLK